MLSFALIPLLASVALAAPAPAVVERAPPAQAGSFHTYNNGFCNENDGSHQTFNNLPPNVCGNLPGASGKIDYLAPGCQFGVYELTSSCTAGNAPDRFFTVDGLCDSFSDYFAYKIICT